MQHSLQRLFSVAAFAFSGLVPAIAHAEAPVAMSVDIAKVIDSSFDWLQSRAKGVGAARPADKPPASLDPTRPVLNPPIRLSLVARDWSDAFNVAGGTMISDDVRLSRSSRMLLGRARLDLGKFQPYVHTALGEWRYDPAILTFKPRNQEYATQWALGFEYKFAKYGRVGFEADYTLLCRESREPQNNPTPSVLGAYAVLHAKF